MTDQQENPQTTDSATQTHSSQHSAGGNGLVLFLVAAVIATIAGHTLLNLRWNYFQMPEDLAMIDDQGASPEQLAKKFAAMDQMNLRNTVLCLSSVGAAVVGVFGVFGGVRQGSAMAAGIGTVTGLLLGGLLGAAGGLLSVHTERMLEESSLEGVVQGILIHAPFLGLMGLAVALVVTAVGIKTGTAQRAVATTVAALLAAALFSPLAMVVFPLITPERVLPESSIAAAVWIGLPCLLIACALARTNPQLHTADRSAT